jgi:hypothetical protein
LFAGILDGGENDVFLGGSRLTKFMESVEAATRSIPVASPIDEPAERSSRSSAGRKGDDEPPAAPSVGDPWTALLEAGRAWLQQAAAATAQGDAAASSLLARDERTGETYVRLPVPPVEVLGQLMTALGQLVEGMKNR